ncbi:MAG TPA: DUF4097 family beta strand repeat-containing protein [Sandaracinaceae bacterium LLY-WYZ-13_1]|nr:DUF4097 family beta strand repeat-containing protein [Sandaracinaceae bacterium LLY-WYZ-13_1]
MRTTTLWILALASLGALTGCFGEERLVASRDAELAADGADTLAIDVGAGSLDVIGEAGRETVQLDVALRTNRQAFSDDDGAEAALEVVLERDDDRLVARVALDDPPSGYFADVVIRVPARLGLTGRDGSGEAVIADVASLDLEDGSGTLDVSRVAGAVAIDDGSGELSLTEVGPTTIEDGSGTIAITGVEGDLSIDDEDGDLEVENVTGSVRLTLGSGNARCVGVDGDVDVVDGSGDLYFEDVAGTVRVEDGSGDVEAVDVGALEMISDESGEVDVR